MPNPDNPRLQKSLTVFGTPLREANAAVLLLHGRTQTPSDMFDLLVRRLDLPALAYLAPVAAERSWYPERFMAPVAANQPQLDNALRRLEELSDELAAVGFAPERQVVMGFSQGACLGCEFVWRQRTRRRFAALLAFTGGLIGPEGTRWESRELVLADLPVLLTGHEHDPWVPAKRMRETARVFVEAGARVRDLVVPGAEHTVDFDEIVLARSLLTEAGLVQLLPAAAPTQPASEGADLPR